MVKIHRKELLKICFSRLTFDTRASVAGGFVRAARVCAKYTNLTLVQQRVRNNMTYMREPNRLPPKSCVSTVFNVFDELFDKTTPSIIVSTDVSFKTIAVRRSEKTYGPDSVSNVQTIRPSLGRIPTNHQMCPTITTAYPYILDVRTREYTNTCRYDRCDKSICSPCFVLFIHNRTGSRDTFQILPNK